MNPCCLQNISSFDPNNIIKSRAPYILSALHICSQQGTLSHSLWLVITWWPLVNCGAFCLGLSCMRPGDEHLGLTYCASSIMWVLLILGISYCLIRNETLCCAHLIQCLEIQKAQRKVICSSFVFLLSTSPCSLLTYFKSLMLVYMHFLCVGTCALVCGDQRVMLGTPSSFHMKMSFIGPELTNYTPLDGSQAPGSILSLLHYCCYRQRSISTAIHTITELLRITPKH